MARFALRTVLAGAVVLAVSATVVAQNKPNFAGTWRLLDASDADGDMVITQDATTLSIAHAHGDGQHKSTFDLTGKEHRSPNPAHRADMDVSTTKWEGSALVIDVTLQNGVKLRDRLSIGSDGLLTFETTAIFPDGRKETTKGVWRKR